LSLWPLTMLIAAKTVESACVEANGRRFRGDCMGRAQSA